MNQDKNIMMKKYLQKIVDHLLEMKKYQSLNNVEVFFVFGSNYKTAMCDWVYGLKIYSEKSYSHRDEIAKNLQMDIRRTAESFFKQSVCATDIIFEKV